MRNKTRPLPWAELLPFDHLRSRLGSAVPRPPPTTPGMKTEPSEQVTRPKDTRGSGRVRVPTQTAGDRKRKTFWHPDSSSEDETHQGHSQDGRGVKRVKVALQPQHEDRPNDSGEDEVCYLV